jgi:hypothetical protein
MTRWQYDPITHRWTPAAPANDDDIVHGARNAKRLPAYARLDVSAERRFDVGWGTLNPVLSLVNLLYRENVLLYSLVRGSAGGPLRIERHTQFPILPSLGMRVEF